MLNNNDESWRANDIVPSFVALAFIFGSYAPVTISTTLFSIESIRIKYVRVSV